MSEPELIGAAAAGDLELVRQLLSSGAVIGERDERGVSALHVAAEAGRLEIVKELVDHGAQVNAVLIVHGQGVNYTPAAAAASRGHVEVMKYLSERGAALYEPHGYMGYFSVMDGAAASGSVAMVRYLHEEKKLPIDEEGVLGATPLHMAIENGREEVVQYLVQHGADPKRKGSVQPSPADLAREKLASPRSDDSMRQKLARILEYIEPPVQAPPKQPAITKKWWQFWKPNIDKMKTRGDIRGLIKALDYERDCDLAHRAALCLCELGGERATEALVNRYGTFAGFQVEDPIIAHLDRAGDARAIPVLVTRLVHELREYHVRVTRLREKTNAAKLENAIRHVLARLETAEATKVLAAALTNLEYCTEELGNLSHYGMRRRVYPAGDQVGIIVNDHDVHEVSALKTAMREAMEILRKMQGTAGEAESRRIDKFVPLCIDCNIRVAEPDGEIWSTTPVGTVSCPKCGERYMFNVSGARLVLTRTTVPVGRGVQMERVFERLPE